MTCNLHIGCGVTVKFFWKAKYLLTEFVILHRLRSCEPAKSQVENERIKLSVQSCPTTFQKLFGLVQILYLTLGSIVVILFPAIFEFLMGNTVGLQEKYQFLPLMAYSVFCAVGNVFIYFSVYFDYAFRKLWDFEENKYSCSFFCWAKIVCPLLRTVSYLNYS